MYLLLFLFTVFGTDFVVGTQNSAESSKPTENLIIGELSKLRKLYDEFKQTYSKGHTGEEEEFSAQYANLHLSPEDWVNQPRVTFGVQGAPKSIDWRKLGAVTAVQNQGSCGSCWSFSAIGVIEGQWYRKSKKLIKLSEQQLLDCDTVSKGCQGGFPTNGYKVVKKMGGVQTAASYPYVGKKGNCVAVASKFVAYVNKTVTLSADEAEIAEWLAANGPVSMSLNAKPLSSYKSGILHPSAANCDKNVVTHAVLAVGYGVEKNVPYWLIKNTYGPKWGENGYFRIYRGDGTCAINKYANSVQIY